jgi:NAD(P)-dependent dehydrogenase (short-subunit alcohol dehydrogenase family)
MLAPAAAFLSAGTSGKRGCRAALATLRCQQQSPVAPRSRLAPSRRELLQGAAAAGLLGRGAPAFAEYGSDVAGGLELVVPQAELLANLASVPARSVIITGANSGVGLAAAKLLTAAGHRVTLACRTQAKADAAAEACMVYAASKGDAGPATGKAGFFAGRRPGGEAVGAECDLSSFASVRAFAESVKGKPLDVLALNAGLSLSVGDNVEKFTADGFELTVGTNHLGHFLLYSLLRPTLAKSASPRLVITGSGVHDPASEGGKQGGPEKWASMGAFQGLEGGKGFSMVDGGKYDPDKAYKDSKLCNLLFMGEAARREQGKMTVNAFSPGLIAGLRRTHARTHERTHANTYARTHACIHVRAPTCTLTQSLSLSLTHTHVHTQTHKDFSGTRTLCSRKSSTLSRRRWGWARTTTSRAAPSRIWRLILLWMARPEAGMTLCRWASTASQSTARAWRRRTKTSRLSCGSSAAPCFEEEG